MLRMSRMLPNELLREQVRKLERLLSLLNEGEMSCCGITFTQCHALVEIGRAGTVSLSALAERLDLDNSTTSRTVQNLVSAGIARREPDPADRRAVVIALSPSGEALFQRVEGNMTNQFESIWNRIPDNKREQVLESIDLLVDALHQTCCATEEQG